MVLRMSIYMNRLWEELVRDQPDLKAVPPIVPVLLHQSETGWTAATSFQDIIAVDPEVRSALRPYIPHFDLLLIDLSEGQVNEQALEEGRRTEDERGRLDGAGRDRTPG